MAHSRRVICLVADGFGVGAAPDAADYGDIGSNTLANTASAVGGVKLPNLEMIGLSRLGGGFLGMDRSAATKGFYGRLQEKSCGKDTTTGHWELAGLVTEEPFATFPEGFSAALVESFIREAGLPGVLANRAASGTEIIEELGEESVRSGKPILYTSADSVFQIAAHEEHFGLERLYAICRVARKLTLPMQIGRVIARPFVGRPGEYRRTENRRDLSIAPGRNTLDILAERSIDVFGVGKIEDIFDHRGLSQSVHTGNNRDSLRASLEFLEKSRGQRAFTFVNLVDFDMLYGHRRDPRGYAQALVDLDAFLPKLLAELSEGDMLLLTSDHGCDPTFRGSDHTREWVPVIGYSPGVASRSLGDRSSFCDVGATVLDAFGIESSQLSGGGTSFYREVM